MNNGLTYAALGDSLTVGTGAVFSGGFVQQYAQLTERILNTLIKVHIYAENGLKTADLLGLITRRKSVRTVISRANIITITIGGNDLLQANLLFQKMGDYYIFNYTLENMYKNMKTLLSEIDSLKLAANTPYFIIIIGLYNPFPSIPYSEYWVNKFNQLFSSFESKNIKFVNIFNLFKFNNQLISSFDQLHPNYKGYQLVAQKIANKGYYPLI